MKTVSLKGFLVLLLVCTTLVGGSALVIYLSNIYQRSTVVSEAQLMTIEPDPSTPFLNATITGQAFNISVNVYNPNPVALKGKILLTFTKTGIISDSVAVTSTWRTPDAYIAYITKTLQGDTLSFKIEVARTTDPYFTFQPGVNPSVVYFTVTYVAAGSYNVTLAVIAS
jgi:hypothetical protein